MSDVQLKRMERDVETALADALKRTLSWLTSYPGGGALGAYDQARNALSVHEFLCEFRQRRNVR